MAKRRKLEAPDPAELAAFEARFRDETKPGPVAPIGHLAADSARAADHRDAGDREAAARDRTDAAAFAEARAKGLLIEELPLDQIDDAAMVRDRAVIDEAELLELRESISRHGLRLPIEVFALPEPRDGRPYGLLSGYRRLMAVRQLHAMTEAEGFATIKAILRDPGGLGGPFVAMVEENEIRAELSHYERGRIAVIAAGQGVFANTEDAVAQLFATASKAKRSKVRSFALIHEELGDLLVAPEEMTEKQGLALAAALRAGGEPDLRAALEGVRAGSFAEAWAALEPVVASFEESGRPARRGGRPKTPRSGQGGPAETLANGITLREGRDGEAWIVRLEGPGMDEEIMEHVLAEIRYLLGRPR